MLSTKTVGNVKQAQHYFLGHDNYYKEEDTLAKDRSSWWGKGAQALGLSGTIDSDRFTELLTGVLPDGQQLGKKVNHEHQHRPGFDLTFSAPKSVSLLAMLGGDERIFSALQRATDKTLQLIERACAQARLTKEGITTYENTHNLVVAKFLHDLSREADPQLHVHCVVMNMTQRSDGQWRSLASQSGKYGAHVTHEINGFLERVRHHKLHYGAIFRAELAFEMKQLGYEIARTGNNGLFEIAGISQKTIDTYSQRSKQITGYMQEYGFSGAKAAAVATIKTRKAKHTINREALDELWQARSEASGIHAIEEVKALARQAHQSNNQRMNAVAASDIQTAKEALQYAIAHLSETHIALKEIQLVNVALQHILGENVNIQLILQLIKDFQKEGHLIALATTSNERQYTTQPLLLYEREILSATHTKPLDAKPIAPLQKIEAYLSQQQDLTLEQKQAIKTLFSSEYRVNLLEGAAGTGKTLLIQRMAELAKLNHYAVTVLTPGKAESLAIKQSLRTTPQTLREWFSALWHQNQYHTVSGFIASQKKALNLHQPSHAKGIIFIDNATLVSSKQMRDLMVIAEKTHQYLIPVGDKKALLSFQAGTPFTQMLAHGAHHAVLTQSMREQNKAIKTAVQDTLQNNIVNAFDKIGHRLFSIDNKAERIAMMAHHYVQSLAKEQQKTLVLMPTKTQCEDMNAAIREALKKEHQLNQVGIATTVLLPQRFSEAQYALAKNYTVGQIIRFNENYRSLAIQRGDYLKIQFINAKQNIIGLENAKGATLQWNPRQFGGKAGSVEVFDLKHRELVVGDKILYQRGWPSNAIHTGERLTIQSIKENVLICERDNRKKVTIDLKAFEARHFDYAYATTPYQKHYVAAHHIIAYQTSGSRQSHQRLFYKTLSQAKHNVWIYTENRTQLLANLQKHSGDKLTAIEALLHDVSWQGANAPALKSDYLRLLEQAITRILLQTQRLTSTKTPHQIAQEAVAYALGHLTEKEAAFQHKQVLEVALKQALGEIDTQTLQKAIVEAEKNGELIRGIYSQDGTRWTTRDAVETERRILNLAKQQAGTLSPIAPTAFVEQQLATHSPKAEHVEAIHAICANTDRYLLVQGYAGTGKTTMLMHLEPLLKQVDAVFKPQAYQLLCLAPTHVAVKELKERGLPAQTLDSFLMEQQKTAGNSFNNQLMIAVDENSMTSNKRMLELLKIMQEKEIRGIFIGDTKQNPSIEAGKPHALLENTLKTIYLTQIERQKEASLLQAVKESYQGDFPSAFNTLQHRIVEVGKEVVAGQIVDNRLARLEAIRDDYLSRTPQKRAQTLIITLGNEERALQNALIREGLKIEGELHGKAYVAPILVPRDVSETERTLAMNYRVGDTVRFGYQDKTLTIEKGEYLTVREQHAKENYLVLEKNNGQSIIWQPRLQEKLNRVGVEIYTQERREMMAGDLIRWTRTDKTLGLLSPELARVEMIENQAIQLTLVTVSPTGIRPQGEPFTINAADAKFQHWDHAYAMTNYSSQGKTVAETIIHLESYRKQLTHQPAFIVALTRAQYDAKIYTDDKAALLQRIVSHTGAKSSALEITGEWQAAEKASHPWSRILPNVPLTAQPTTPQQLTLAYPKPAQTLKKDVSAEPLFDAKHLTRLLQAQAETVVERLLGEPKERHAQQYRYGAKGGSLIVTLQGEKRGLWHDFQTGEGGNLLQLVAKQHGLNSKNKQDFKKTLAIAAQLLGTSGTMLNYPKRPAKTPLDSPSRQAKTLTPEQTRSLHYAHQLAKESIAIQGTLAEEYLRKDRGISLEKLPDSFRFHPGIYSKKNKTITPALLVVAKDEKGSIQAVQAIFLDEKTANKAAVKVQKQTWGLPSSGATVDLSKISTKETPVYLAEGPETGLSIYQAMPYAQVKVTLGKSNFKNINTKTTGQDIVFCLDNDGNNPNTDKLTQVAAEKFSLQGKTVWIAKPETVGKDYNDLLKEQGEKAVKHNIEQAVSYTSLQEKTAFLLTLKEALFDKEKVTLKSDPSDSPGTIEPNGNQSNHITLNNVLDKKILEKVAHSILYEETLLAAKTHHHSQHEASKIRAFNSERSTLPGSNAVKNVEKSKEKEPDL